MPWNQNLILLQYVLPLGSNSYDMTFVSLSWKQSQSNFFEFWIKQYKLNKEETT